MKHEFLRRTGRTALGLALSLTMAASLLPGVALAEEADGAEAATGAVKVENKYLGVDVMAGPVADPAATEAWKGSYVYFGQPYKNNDLKYRVLSTNETGYTTDGNSTLFLDCDYVIDGWTIQMPKTWDEIGLGGDEGWFEKSFYNGSYFSEQEKAAVAASTRNDTAWKNDNTVAGQHVFTVGPELMTRKYGYSYTNNWSAAENRVKTAINGAAGKYVYWNRPYWNDIPVVYQISWSSFTKGQIASIKNSKQNVPGAITPAMNLKTESILFTNLLSGEAGKVGAAYKLTILDDKLTIGDTPTAERGEENDKSITVTYSLSGDNKANVKKLGLMVLDKAFEAGNMSNTNLKAYYESSVTADSTTATFTLAEDEDSAAYYYYIVPVTENEGNRTDYAGTPVRIQIPGQQVEQEYTIKLNPGNATDDDVTKFGTDGTVSKLGVEKTTAFVYSGYQFRDSGYTVNAEDGQEAEPHEDVTVTRKYREKNGENNGEWKPMEKYSAEEALDIFTINNTTEYSKLYEIGYFIGDEEEAQPKATRLVAVIYQKGDVNRDTNINAADATVITIHAKGGKQITLDDLLYKTKVVDVNGDGNVNASDATGITIHAKGGKQITQEYKFSEDKTMILGEVKE